MSSTVALGRTRADDRVGAPEDWSSVDARVDQEGTEHIAKYEVRQSDQVYDATRRLRLRADRAEEAGGRVSSSSPRPGRCPARRGSCSRTTGLPQSAEAFNERPAAGTDLFISVCERRRGDSGRRGGWGGPRRAHHPSDLDVARPIVHALTDTSTLTKIQACLHTVCAPLSSWCLLPAFPQTDRWKAGPTAPHLPNLGLFSCPR